MNQALAIRVRQHRGHVIITVAGEIDIATAPQLRDRLAPLAAGGRPVIADLTQVTFIDAAGLGVLAGAAGKAAASGGSLHVVTARHLVRRALAVTGLDRTIPLARTRAEALASLHAGPDAGPGGTQPPAGSPGPGRDR
jgi:anti-sigma B factor antagonist